MAKVYSPEDVLKKGVETIPDYVIDAFNALLTENYQEVWINITTFLLDNGKQWMDNVWTRNLLTYRGLGVNLKDLVEVKQLLNLTYLNRRQKILNKSVILS